MAIFPLAMPVLMAIEVGRFVELRGCLPVYRLDDPNSITDAVFVALHQATFLAMLAAPFSVLAVIAGAGLLPELRTRLRWLKLLTCWAICAATVLAWLVFDPGDIVAWWILHDWLPVAST